MSATIIPFPRRNRPYSLVERMLEKLAWEREVWPEAYERAATAAETPAPGGERPARSAPCAGSSDEGDRA